MANLKWTPERIEKVLEYMKSHSHAETIQHFHVSSSQLYVWKKGLPGNHYSKQQKGRRKTNGSEAPVQDEAQVRRQLRVSLMWMERFVAGLRPDMGRGRDRPYDLNALHAYRTLRGEE